MHSILYVGNSIAHFNPPLRGHDHEESELYVSVNLGDYNQLPTVHEKSELYVSVNLGDYNQLPTVHVHVDLLLQFLYIYYLFFV